MPPKGKKGKKSKKDDWSGDEMGEQLPVLNKPAAAEESDEEVAAPAKSRFSAFAMDDSKEVEEEVDDGGGLMASISKASTPAPKRDKKSKKKNKPDFADLEENEVPEGGAEANEVESKAPVAVSADDWLDAEFGDKKDKKGKKQKGGKKAKEEPIAEDEETAAKESPITPVAQAETKDDDDDEQEDASAKPLSKKEKEKLKKQRQKEKEKAAKGKSKPAAASSSAPETPAEVDSPVPATEEVEDDGEGAGETAASKNKKKKKKAGTKEEAPAPAKGGKVSKQVLAMREALAKQQAAEAAQKEAEEAERRRIEEEEQREKDEAAKIEAARLAKKQKQKDKEAMQKAQGTFKTPAQKKEEARLAARREATLASGIKIAGLEEDKEAAPAKKVVYSNKKKGPAKKSGPRVLDNLVLNTTSEEPASPSTVAEEVESPKVEEVKTEPVEEVADVKDDWDAASGDDLKDSWDADSEEETPAPKKEVKPAAKETKAPTPAKKEEPKPAAKETPKAKEAPKAAAATKAPEKATPAPVKKPEVNGKAAPRSAAVEESSSEEESESESESDSESDSEDSDSEDDSDESSSEDERVSAVKLMEQKRKAELAERKKARVAAAIANRDVNDLRSPICCILGHVDTGKTKLLDKIRQTNVQEGEAGGITQQIGATYFPIENVRKKTVVLGDADLKEYKLPGLLVIDTPGHESFTNLRTRGSSLCNIAILVVDIVHGLEPQTLESLRLLRDKKTPFIVALNKIDRMYGWKAIPDAGFQESYAQQSRGTKSEFEDRMKKTIVEFAEQGLNAAPYYENKDLGRTVSLVPTSAITGEGIPDMLMLIIKLTQERMSNNLMYLSELECTVLEVKVIEGLGTTIDVVLSNGILREGDRIVVCGLNGAISTQVRALLTPQPLKEMRIKGSYVHHKEVKASLGIKIVAPDLEKAIAGSRLLLLTEDDDEDDLKQEIMSDLKSLLNSVDRSGKGVWVQASTLGALEALLDFLKNSKIPVAGINIGPVYKRDIMRAAVMLERAPEYAVCLCFDVAIDKDAEKLADEYGIKLFRADIIYHLFDAFTAHNKAVLEAKQKDAAPTAVWPCRLKTLACFAKRDPIILGVDIIEGSLRIGTPLAVVKKDPETGKKVIHSLGRITSMEINHKTFTKITKAQVGAGVAIKVEHAVYENGKMFGRHFDDKDELISLVSRKSIDTLKNVFRSEVEKSDWALIVKLKAQLDIA